RPPVGLLQDVRQKPEKTRALDGAGELALLLGRDSRDAARHDLAALGNIPPEQAHALVVDLWRVLPGAWAALAAAMEGPAGTTGDRDVCHDLLLRPGLL